jgi:uncharacterized protein with HEPN domain
LPSEKPAQRLEDIIENAQAIQRYIAGMDLAAFEEEHKTYDAVERCLERIGEAAAKLGDLASALMPEQRRDPSISEEMAGFSKAKAERGGPKAV